MARDNYDFEFEVGLPKLTKGQFKRAARNKRLREELRDTIDKLDFVIVCDLNNTGLVQPIRTIRKAMKLMDRCIEVLSRIK